MGTVNDYFVGAIHEMIARARGLLGKIPPGLVTEFIPLANRCEQRIRTAIRELGSLLDDPRMREPSVQAERLRSFQRIVSDLDTIEKVGICALERANDADHRLNLILKRIRQEIAYPLLPPVVSALSRRYFYIDTSLNLLFVPLSEGQFLLHLPDLYHELAHPLTEEKDYPRVRPFQQALRRAVDEMQTYLEAELQQANRRRGPDQTLNNLILWQRAWIRFFAVEFFCDLFAVYTLGPAFAWSHLHLSAKRGGDPFYVPLDILHRHPADDARMIAILAGLRLTGFAAEADDIHAMWNHLLTISGAKAEPEYWHCFPQAKLQALAHQVLQAVQAMGCRIATPETSDPLHTLLNRAWLEFWANPTGYTTWEESAVDRLSVDVSNAVVRV